MPATPAAATRHRLAALVAAMIAAAPLSAQSRAAAGGGPGVYVSTAWLAEHRGDPGLVLIQVGQMKHEYEESHLAGARFVPFDALSRSAPGATLELPPVAQLDSVLEAAGVSNGSRVVIYGAGGHSALGAARALMTLEYAGLAGRVSILDGGLAAWREENRPIATGDEAAPARGSLTLRPRPDVVVDAAWVHENSSRPTLAVLDARAPQFYTGASAGAMPRAGHIPHASNIPFSSLLDASGRLKDSTQLRAIFDAAGVRPGQEVVTYCHIGLQGSLLYAAARQLGHPAHLYDGSFEDWSHNTSYPVVTGDAKQ